MGASGVCPEIDVVTDGAGVFVAADASAAYMALNCCAYDGKLVDDEPLWPKSPRREPLLTVTSGRLLHESR
jgi:hypothetical protein